MKILIVGGHMAPALATIQHVPQKAEIVYVGRKHPFEGDKGLSLEYTTINNMGIKFIPLETARLQRSITRHSVPSLLKFPGGIRQAMDILRKEKPDVVVGFGGYLSLSVGIAAWMRKIPLVIHEQTLHAGLANKLLGKFANKIAISFRSSEKYFPKTKTELIGNPHLMTKPSSQIRRLIAETDHAPRIVVTGGSAGSHAINELMENIIPDLTKDYVVIHQTGDAKEFGDFDRLQNLRKSLSQNQQENYHVIKFIDPSDFDYLYENASVVVSRSGISTVTTLLLLQIPSILIPLKSGQKNEQLTNAKMLEKMGFAKIFSQGDESKKLAQDIRIMVANRATVTKKKNSAEENRHLTAAQHFVELIYVTSQTYSQKKS
jgi:UDP-N-acetylglucosamine--N-acetylmuramyl-(pentapeptide) pyrophosphoryl-undecaprenol N-acetylglucosamine transferase